VSAYDLSIWRGNNPPIAWRFRNADQTLFDVSGSRFVMDISIRSVSRFRKDTDVNDNFVVDAAASTLTWAITVAESRLIPEGRIADYEIERWIGNEQLTLISGKLIGLGGKNFDVAASGGGFDEGFDEGFDIGSGFYAP
jgi:predicted pyridoxine 5'-phosphate oxidase superfamily flavin-nucleotide-binding protein